MKVSGKLKEEAVVVEDRVNLSLFRSFIDIFQREGEGVLKENPDGLQWTHQWERVDGRRILVLLLREERGEIEILGEGMGGRADLILAEGSGKVWVVPKDEVEGRKDGRLRLEDEWISSKFYRGGRGSLWEDRKGSLKNRAKRLAGSEVEGVPEAHLKIFRQWKGGMGYRKLGEEYGVSPCAIRSKIEGVLRAAEGSRVDMTQGKLKQKGKEVWDGERREWMKDRDWEDFTSWFGGKGYGWISNVRGDISPMGVKGRIERMVKRLEKEGKGGRK